MRRQILRDLGGDQVDDLRVKDLAEVAKYFRWRNDHEFLEAIGVSMAIERFGNLVGKPFLCKVMPVDFFHGTSANAETCGGSAWTIRALLPVWRVVLLENPFNDKIDA